MGDVDIRLRRLRMALLSVRVVVERTICGCIRQLDTFVDDVDLLLSS